MNPTPSLLDRTLANLRQAWRGISRPSSNGMTLSVHPDLPARDVERLREQMSHCLEGRGGVVSAKARAAALGEAYLSLDGQGRARFLRLLAEEFDIDREALARAVADFAPTAGAADAAVQQARLRKALEPPRLKLLSQFNSLPQGVKFLVDLRAELRRLAADDPAMIAMDEDLKGLLSSWFDIGFLTLRRLSWAAPASLLEHVIAHEAVHQIRSWDDLKHRLDAADRRVYGFFHPHMPDEPIIFVQVALTNGIAGNIQTLLDDTRTAGNPAAADTAIFYSISNTQPGLQGVNLGNFLIKRVVDDLTRDLPRLKTFATLSPIPGFRRWLDGRCHADDSSLLSEADRRNLERQTGSADLVELLDRPGWYTDAAAGAALQGPLMRLGARYLAHERQRGRAINPVANFHLSNGARIERLNWLADTSEKGLNESAGMMVNYLYKLDDIERNHEAYRSSCEIATSPQVRATLKD